MPRLILRNDSGAGRRGERLRLQRFPAEARPAPAADGWGAGSKAALAAVPALPLRRQASADCRGERCRAAAADRKRCCRSARARAAQARSSQRR